jgi:serine/threonine protein phosphatase PrpC
MDLFRRIFGKTSDEADAATAEADAPKKTETAPDGAMLSTEDSIPTVEVDAVTDELASDDFSPLDPATRPVGPPPAPPGRQNLVSDGVTQPLNSDMLTIRKTEHLAFGQTSDVGLVRTNNQDSALSFYFTSDSVEDFPDFGVFIVADGMGGHHDGEKASALTTRLLATKINNEIYMPILMDVDATERVPTSEALVTAVKQANEEVLRLVPEGGTTVTAAVVIGDLAHIVHVGDSRAYLMTKDGIEQITRDHSLVQRLIELDQLTHEEAEVHPQKNVLYRALGQNETLEVDSATRRLPPNSRLLICSDGLWGQVEERELYEVGMNVPDPQQACDKLVALANTRGGVDNITAILLKIS